MVGWKVVYLAVWSLGPQSCFKSCLTFILKPFQNVMFGVLVQIKGIFPFLISFFELSAQFQIHWQNEIKGLLFNQRLSLPHVFGRYLLAYPKKYPIVSSLLFIASWNYGPINAYSKCFMYHVQETLPYTLSFFLTLKLIVKRGFL